MDKSPLKTLTLEDFLESERHKLTGTLTPVTTETFAKWKKERLDKKTAEAEARKAKEDTGRAMFERGDWQNRGGSDDGSESESEEEEEEEQEEGDQLEWDLERLRLETEKERERKEEERVGAGKGIGSIDAMVADDGDGGGSGEGSSRGVNGTPNGDGQ